MADTNSASAVTPEEPWWLPALTPAERTVAGSVPPSWVMVTKQVLTIAPSPTEISARPAAGHWGQSNWLIAFGLVLAPYARFAAGRLQATRSTTSDDIDLTKLTADLARDLTARLARIAARTLVLELNVMRARGQLCGTGPEERFADFIDRARQPEALRRILRRYPVLARLLAQTCEQTVTAQMELLDRFVADRAAIVTTLLAGRDPGPLVGSTCHSGDSHRGGRAVAVLQFAAGARVVYKPRPLAAHQHFNEVVAWLNRHLGDLALRTVRLLNRPGYGWTAFVPRADCPDTAAVARFYHRQGALLALLHALNGADVHYENVIACGDQPVLVDVETLFHPDLSTPSGAGPDPAALALAASVQRTALLPQQLLGEHGSLDISGLGGDDGALMPWDVASWDAAGTDEMRLVRRRGFLTGAGNRPSLGGTCADPIRFAAELLAGFRAAYDVIVANRIELCGPGGLLHRFADDEIRVVARATRFYATLLDESTHPEVLRNAEDRDRIFEVLTAASVEDPRRQRLVRHERAELWRGDVPIFTVRPGGTGFYSGDGDRIDGILTDGPLQRVADKVGRMGALDRADQEWIIQATLATRGTPASHASLPASGGGYPSVAPDPDRLLAAARGVADRIIARGYDDGTRINWLGLELLEERHWTVMPLGGGLGNGYSGTALFLAQLAAFTGEERYAAVARRALHPLPRLVEALAADAELAQVVGCGGFAGLGGMAYALTHVSALLGDAELAAWIEPVVQVAATTVAADAEYGVDSGAAGCLAAMLAVHDATGSPAAGRLADRCVAHLTGAVPAWTAGLRRSERSEAEHPGTRAGDPGFARGAAGIAWALRRYGVETGDADQAAFGLARLVADTAIGPGWCNGDPGVGLALLDTGASAHPATAARVAAAVRGGAIANHSLCHGEMGRFELLTKAAHVGLLPESDVLQQVGAALSVIEHAGPRCGTPGDAAGPGLLNGLAGIGHGLLRLAFPDRVPSLLLLQPPPSPSATARTRRAAQTQKECSNAR